MIEPFFFADGELFGCYHPPSQADSRRLAVICPPLFDEYKRCYRGLADLANGLADQGIHVLRFDYFGTGESWGLLEEASIDRWTRDVRTAVEEGMDLCGADEVILVGVRFGGTLAAQVVEPGVVAHVLWDPPLSGTEYLEDLDAADRDLEKVSRASAVYTNQRPDELRYEYFALPEGMREALRTLSVAPLLEDDEKTAYFMTTDSTKTGEVGGPKAWEFAGIEYVWSGYHEGVLSLKPALEALARKVVS